MLSSILNSQFLIRNFFFLVGVRGFASRRGDSLYSIYQRLEQSEVLLQEQQKNSFELLFETLLPSLTQAQAYEIAQFPINSLEVYTTSISLHIAEILSQFKGDVLSLNKVKEIDEACVKMLSQYKGVIYTTEKIRDQIKKYSSNPQSEEK